MIYLQDTDHFSLLQRGGAEGRAIKARLASLAPDAYGICVVTYAEQAKGWLAEVARATTPAAEIFSFGELQTSFRFATAFAMWDYSPEAAALCAALKKQKLRVGTQDLRIASIALVNGATLLTRNTRDFERVPGLLYADWTG